MAISNKTGYFLGSRTNNYPKPITNVITELVDTVNGITDGTGDVSADNVTVAGDLTVTGTSTFNGAIVLGNAAADSLTVTATTTYGEPINYDNATGITAFATGGQASATALTAEINNITTCATAGDSVKLPAAIAGKHVYVKNSGAAALDIFPASADSIDALAINLAIRIQPGSSVHFYAKDAIVWESTVDASFTLVAPTTNSGQLEFKAANSAGNTVTTITNASQSGARTYTIPDAGASASFAMTEGAQTINGIKTFGSGIVTPVGAVGTPSVQIGSIDTGLYQVSGTQTGVSQDGALVAVFDANGITTQSVRATVDPGTANAAGGITAVSYGDGRNWTTVITVPSVTDAITVADNAALADGFLIYTLPVGAHVITSAYMSMAVTLAEDTTATADVGIGTLIGSGANATLNLVGAGAENIITGQTAANCSGTATVKTVTNAPLAIESGDSHEIYFNIADTWADTAGIDLTGDIAGTITICWTKVSA